MARIKIHNVLHERAAKPLRNLLHGKTCLNLQLVLCPIGTSLDVFVETHDAAVSEVELTAMVLSVLSHQVCRAARTLDFNREPSGPVF